MKLKHYILLGELMLCAIFSAHSQSVASLRFDIRGRDCNGGGDLCSAYITSGPNATISIEKTDQSTFVLTFVRTSVTENEEISIAGKPFSNFQAAMPTTFIQDGDLKFTNEVLQTLGIDPKYNLLKKGSYPLQINDNVVKITLTLTENNKT